MATPTYKTVIKKAIDGFNSIQTKLSEFTDLGVSAVSSATVSGVTTVSGSLTPETLVSNIGKMATIKKSDGTFISGKVAYRGAGTSTVNPTISQSGNKITVTFSKTVSDAGYYTSYKVSNGSTNTYTIPSGSCTVSGGGLTNGGIVTDSANNSGVYVSRAAVTDTHSAGYIAAKSETNVISAASTYIKGITVPKGKTFDSFTLTAGDSDTTRTTLNTLTTNSYTKITKFTNSGKVMELDNPGIIESMYGSNNRITTLAGTTTVTNHGTSTSAGALTISDNTYGTVNIWNAGNNRGVKVANHTVTVDGTTVTDSNGDLKTTSRSDGGNTISGTNVTLSDTDSGISVGASAKVSTGAGWVSSGTTTSTATTKYISAVTVPENKTLSSVTINADSSSDTDTTTGTLTTLTNNGVITTYAGSGKITNLGTSSAAATLNVTTNKYGTVNVSGGKNTVGGVTVANKIVSVSTGTANSSKTVTNSSGNLITATPKFDGGGLSGGGLTATGTGVTLSDTDNGIKVEVTRADVTRAAVLYNGKVEGWVSVADNTVASEAVTLSSTDNNKITKWISKVTVPKDKTFTVAMTADSALDTSSDLAVTNAKYRRINVTNTGYGTVIVNGGGAAGVKVDGVNGKTATVDGTTVTNTSGALITTSLSYNDNGTVTTGTGWITGGTVAAGTISSGTEDLSTKTDATKHTAIETIVPSKGYLYIGAGYYPNTQISLDSILGGSEDKDGDTAITAITAGYLRSGFKAYNIDGEEITGSMANWTPSSTYYTSSNTGYGKVTGYTYVNSSTKYIKKHVGESVTSAGTVSYSGLSGLDLSSTDTASGITFTPSASGVSKQFKITTAGWIPTGTYGTKDGTLTGTAQYVTGVTISANKTLSSLSNSGTITNYSGNGTITNIGNETAASTLNITTNTYGTVNISGGKNAVGGVTIANKTVSVSTGTASSSKTVTNSSGNLITAAPSFSGGTVSGSVSITSTLGNIVTDTTGTSGLTIDIDASGTAKRTAVTYSKTVDGWLTKSNGASALTAGSNTSLTGDSENHVIKQLKLTSGNKLGHYTSSTDYLDGVEITGASGTTTALYAGFKAAYGDLYIRNNGASSYTKVATSGKLTTTSRSDGGNTISGSNVTLDTTNNGIAVNAEAKVSTGTGWVSSGTTTSTATTKYISALIVPENKTLSSVTINADSSSDSDTTAGVLTTLANNGVITTYSGSGKITTYSNTGTITTMTGSRTITNLGSSSTAGTLTLTTNTYGTVNISGGKNAVGGVTIANKVVSVSTGTKNTSKTVTNSSGNLITATPSFGGGGVSGSVNITSTLGNIITDNNSTSGLTIDISASGTAKRAAVTYSGAVDGWLTKSSGASALTAGSDTSLTGDSESYIIKQLGVTAGNVLGSSSYDGVTVTGASGKTTALYAGFGAAYGDLYIRNNGATSYTKVATSGKLTTTSRSDDGNTLTGTNVTLNDTNNGIAVASSAKFSTGTGWITSGTATSTATKYISAITIPENKTLSSVTINADSSSDTDSTTGVLTTLANNGVITTYSGSGKISNIGTSSAAATLNVTTNTYGTINIWNAGGDRGVKVVNHTVTADGTTVTNSNGDLITTSRTDSGNTISGTNVTLGGTDNGIKVEASAKVSTGTGWITSGTTTSKSTKYISDITVPKDKTLNSVTLASGSSSTSRTKLNTLTVNGYTTVNTLTLTGIIENLSNNNGIITTLTTTDTTNGNRITNVTGLTNVTNLGTSSKTGTMNILTNTYGTVNVSGGKNAVGGVTIANKVVSVSTGTKNTSKTVTNSSGNLITDTPAFDGGGLSGGGLTNGTNSGGGLTASGTSVTLSDTNNGIAVTVTRAAFSNTVTRAAVTRSAVLYNGSVEGWVSVADNATALSSGSLKSTTTTVSLAKGSITKYISSITVPSGKTLSTVSNGGTITTLSGTGSIGTQSGIQTVTSNTGTIATTTNNGEVNVTTNAANKSVNIGTNNGTINITTASTGLVNYEDWAIQYNSSNKSLEFVFSD